MNKGTEQETVCWAGETSFGSKVLDREVTGDNKQESAEVGGPRDEGKRRDSGNTEVTKARGIYVVVVRQKPTHLCKAIILFFFFYFN